ncbi:MAG TPA: hypothetical protein VJ547_07145 [Candidatus Thermoplasmatota archaeon]|nr:hypothetical protein [Candidatus Thermoplasmatota archaeon]
MLDVALVALISDMSEQAGVQGIIQYWERVGAQLAKRMGKEAYMGWPSYNVALRERRTAFSIDGDVTALTDLAITDEDGDVVGYIYALKDCVFTNTTLRIRNTVGSLPSADQEVAEEYSTTVRNTAVCNFCVIHQKFWEEAAKNITVADRQLEALPLAQRGFQGQTKIAEAPLKRIGVNPEYIRSLLRNYACVYALVMKGSKGEETGDKEAAEKPKAAKRGG